MEGKLLVSAIATIIMVAFAAVVLARFVRRRQAHNFFWGVGLLMFGMGTFAEAYLAVAWNETLFRSWYLFGAMLNAGWLGHGTLTLLARRRWVNAVGIVLVIFSLIGAAAVFAIPLNGNAFTVEHTLGEQYKAILPAGAPVRMFTPFFNIYGSLFLIGGAVYSAYMYWRRQASVNRVLGNVLIAVGALTVASAGTLTRLFFGGFMAWSELIAAVLMFAGFMIASAPAAIRAPEQAQRAV